MIELKGSITNQLITYFKNFKNLEEDLEFSTKLICPTIVGIFKLPNILKKTDLSAPENFILDFGFIPKNVLDFYKHILITQKAKELSNSIEKNSNGVVFFGETFDIKKFLLFVGKLDLTKKTYIYTNEIIKKEILKKIRTHYWNVEFVTNVLYDEIPLLIVNHSTLSVIGVLNVILTLRHSKAKKVYLEKKYEVKLNNINLINKTLIFV